MLRDGLFVASPQLVFAQMGLGRPLGEIAEAGLNLCARYFVRGADRDIVDRTGMLVTPAQLQSYLESTSSMRGAGRAAKALRWVVANSGSPMESKLWVLVRFPRRLGGFGLPFDAMNYDILPGQLSRLTTQSRFSIDLVCTSRHFGLEYDGDCHENPSLDKRRRNELSALGWEIFPIDKSVVYDAEETERMAHQIARRLGLRIQNPRNWESRYAELRRALRLSG